MANSPTIDASRDAVLDVVRRTWGFGDLRPLQWEAIQAGLTNRDSLVVLPTGGGKSLCYQTPPLIAGRTDVVLSPLISLIKDQVDGLTEQGYPAVGLHSGLTPEELSSAEEGIRRGRFRLVFAAPERAVSYRFQRLFSRETPPTFVIDEAHCISHWGHDFRPEYRRLGELRERFPGASLHAFTATATPLVRDDIVRQLALRDPLLLVGTFDRPNLVYRVLPREDVHEQTLTILKRHRREAAIAYCISRHDTERMAAALQRGGIRARHYHAGMTPDERRRTQDAFASERIDVVAATVAFGMGIDRSDVRCVVHAGMPKSVEHYQQESGRAGRDGLPAECVLLYSAADAMRWEGLITRPREEIEVSAEQIAAQLEHLDHMRRYCATFQCRHAALSGYFGQRLDGSAGCGACDVCLGEIDGAVEDTVTAQKILSCVARVEQRFGVGHVADVLLGARTDRVGQLGHDKLSTFALMRGTPRKRVMSLVYQIVDQGLLERTAGELPVLRLNPASWEVMRSQRKVYFTRARPGPNDDDEADGRDRGAKWQGRGRESWEGVDMALFERLRALRRRLAEERGVPPFVIFGDASLREMARDKPSTPEAMLKIHGVGEKKLAALGDLFLACVRGDESGEGFREW